MTNTKSIACRCMVSNQDGLKFETLLIPAYFASDNTRQMIYLNRAGIVDALGIPHRLYASPIFVNEPHKIKEFIAAH